MGLVTDERKKQSHSSSWTVQPAARAAVSSRQTAGRWAEDQPDPVHSVPLLWVEPHGPPAVSRLAGDKGAG